MLFNADKCRRLHMGHSYPSVNYSISGVEIKNVKAEKDLGVAICCTIDPRLQCAKVISTANKVLRVIKRTYVHKSQSNIMYLYKSLVRPHLEYCFQAWHPHLQKDIDNIEKVQKRATRMIPEISSLSYDERLYKCSILSIEMRRLRSDLILVSKMVKGFVTVVADKFFQFLEDPHTRGHNI